MKQSLGCTKYSRVHALSQSRRESTIAIMLVTTVFWMQFVAGNQMLSSFRRRNFRKVQIRRSLGVRVQADRAMFDSKISDRSFALCIAGAAAVRSTINPSHSVHVVLSSLSHTTANCSKIHRPRHEQLSVLTVSPASQHIIFHSLSFCPRRVLLLPLLLLLRCSRMDPIDLAKLTPSQLRQGGSWGGIWGCTA